MSNMRKSITIGMVMAVGSTQLFAAGAPVANQFSSGTTISSGQVNNNFQELADRIDVISPDVITFSNYSIGTGSVEWMRERTDAEGVVRSSCTREFITNSPADGSGNYTQTYALTQADGVTKCFEETGQYQNISDGVLFKSTTNKRYNPPGTLFNEYTDVADIPFLLRPSTMYAGQAYAGGAPFTRTFTLRGGVVSADVIPVYQFRQTIMSGRTSLGTDTDCIQYTRTDRGNRNGPALRDSLRISCTGKGPVLMIRNENTSDGRVTLRQWVSGP